jgi:hypothetical protein
MKRSWFIVMLFVSLAAWTVKAQSVDSAQASLDLAMNNFQPLYIGELPAVRLDSLLANKSCCWAEIGSDSQRQIYWFYECPTAVRVATGLTSTNEQPVILAVVFRFPASSKCKVFSHEADNEWLKASAVATTFWELSVKIKAKDKSK